MVASIAGQAEGQPPVVALARVVRRATTSEASSTQDPTAPRWWLDTYWGPDQPLRQMYAASEILGLPAVGLVAAAEPGWQVTGVEVTG